MDYAVTAPLKTVEASTVATMMREIGQRAKSAARILALASTAQKDKALAGMAEALRAREADILSANADDMAEAKAAGATAAFPDRPGRGGAAPPWPTGSTACGRSPIRWAR